MQDWQLARYRSSHFILQTVTKDIGAKYLSTQQVSSRGASSIVRRIKARSDTRLKLDVDFQGHRC
jgi:hypothetical protein